MCNAISPQQNPENDVRVLFLSPDYRFEGLFSGLNWKDFLLSHCAIGSSPFIHFIHSPLFPVTSIHGEQVWLETMGTESGQANYWGVRSLYLFLTHL